MSMSKTAAIRAARAAVCQPIHQSRTSYLIIGPYRDNDPHGPYTEARESSYSEAVAHRARWCASVALSLMGCGSDDALDAAHDKRYGGIPVLVEVGIRAHRRASGA